jgi:predicted nucleic acid-binding protein
VLDASTQAAAAAARELREPLPFTGLAELELQNAISLRVFRRQMTAAEAAEAWRAVQHDIADGVLVPAGIPASVYERAVRLSRERTPGTGCRSLDVLHVALALVQGAEAFLTFDRRQRALARAEGLKVPLRIR